MLTLQRIRFSVLPVILCLLYYTSRAQDSAIIKVLFLYGSKPAHAYKQSEQKWFGGMPGGHVGVEAGNDSVLNFTPQGRFHWFAKKDSLHSRFVISTETEFWQIMGGNGDSMKKTIVFIPVTSAQKAAFDSLQAAYLTHTPYDYAFIGMRCGAAAYDVLAHINVLKRYTYRKTYMKIFYPKKLRRRLLKLAGKNGWRIDRHAGTTRRIWEGD